MTRPLLALSNVIIDRVRESDGREHPPCPGGAGLYAAVAMRMWWPHVALVAGVGTDFDAVTDGATARYGLDPRGPVVREGATIESVLTYFADGSRSEVASHGPEHFARMEAEPDDIHPALLPATGAYVFRDADPRYWRQVADRRDRLGRILWEIDSGFARSGDVAALRATCGLVDAVSVNLAEARDLFGDGPPEALMDRLRAAGAGVATLRMGADGALLAGSRGDVLHVRPPVHPVVDVTGGGNAFSGGLLAGLCLHPGDLAAAGRCAAAAAACVIAQRGPPPAIDGGALATLAAATVVAPFKAR